jgi:type IV pilus assembly protein PilY1
VDSQGKFYPSSKSFWSAALDGGEVELGGVGDVLLRRTTPRKIYTLLPGDAADEDNGPDINTSFDLTDLKNAFTKDNARLTSNILAVSSDEKNKLIDFVHGLDAYDDNGNTIFEQEKELDPGSFIHSRPYIIHYKNRTVIYAGSNDGMLHAFNDYPVGGSGDGEELWAFIPPSLLGRGRSYIQARLECLWMASPKAYVTYDTDGNVTKAILIFGLRREEIITMPSTLRTPCSEISWRIYKNKNSDFRELAQTWSAPDHREGTLW